MPWHYGILNFFLALLILLLSFKNYEIWIKEDSTPLKKEESRRSEAKIESSYPGISAKQKIPLSSLTVISEKNIFHPERREFILSTPEQPRPINRPQIQLQGILITDEIQRASLILQGKSLSKGERAAKTLSLGDQIGEYKLTRILPDRIILEGPGDTFEVLLYDLKSPKKRVTVRPPSKPTEITPVSPVSPRTSVPRQTSPSGAPQLGSEPFREVHPPGDQPPLPRGTSVIPGSSLSPERQIPLPEELREEKN